MSKFFRIRVAGPATGGDALRSQRARAAVVLMVPLVVGVACAGCRAHSLTRAQASPPQDETVLQGVLTSVWGDPQAGSPRLLLYLTDSAGTTLALQVSESVLEAAGGLRTLNGRQVVVTVVRRPADSVTGERPAEVRTIRLAGPDEIQQPVSKPPSGGSVQK